MMDQHGQAFKEEAYELLAELETSLLELEENPGDMELIGRVFRAMHTIKGSGAMFGFDDIAAFTHEVETIFDMVRNNKLTVTKTLVNLTLEARDQIKTMLDASGGNSLVDATVSSEIIGGLRKLTPQVNSESIPDATPVNTAPTAVTQLQTSAAVTYRIRFKPVRDIFANGTNPLVLLNELRDLGTCNVIAQLCDVPTLTDMNPENCYVYWDIILTSDQGIDAIKDVFIFVEDDSDLKIEVIDSTQNMGIEGGNKKIGEILVERGDIFLEDMHAILATQKKLGELLVDKGLVTSDKVRSALTEQKHVKESRQELQNQDVTATIRVPAEKLDILVNLVGELVTIQARLTQTATGRHDAELDSIAEEVERLTGELRNNALNIRMLPIGTTFSKFKRLVRDLSNDLGKEIELTTEGAETELDKTVIEKLNDPLVHLIRNSIDHGIESPEVRESTGKPRLGTVHLAAIHSGDSVHIIITDDGAGLDKEVIRAKAIEKGLISASADLSEKEIFAQIFAPGFSTANKVTSVSGRGVGMDVVKRAIDALRGKIEIESKHGEGTTIRIQIPLTLAIIESLLVKIGVDRFLIPLSLVHECVELSRADVVKANGRNLATVRGQMVPYIPLRERFCIGGSVPEIEQIVITQVDGALIGVVVDHVIGEHQTVIKSLGKMYRDVGGVSGATILGDGNVALILDIPHLLHEVEMEAVHS
jgi:two-component system chemotaxis sensor kinase CheA